MSFFYILSLSFSLLACHSSSPSSPSPPPSDMIERKGEEVQPVIFFFSSHADRRTISFIHARIAVNVRCRRDEPVLDHRCLSQTRLARCEKRRFLRSIEPTLLIDFPRRFLSDRRLVTIHRTTDQLLHAECRSCELCQLGLLD